MGDFLKNFGTFFFPQHEMTTFLVTGPRKNCAVCSALLCHHTLIQCRE